MYGYYLETGHEAKTFPSNSVLYNLRNSKQSYNNLKLNQSQSTDYSLTLEAPVVLHYLKAPTAVKLTGVCFIALFIYIMLSREGKYLKIINCLKVVTYFVMFYTYDVSNRPIPGNIADNE